MRLWVLCVVVLSGCCIDPEVNAELGNIITYERGKVCADSTQRTDIVSKGKICGRICSKGTP